MSDFEYEDILNYEYPNPEIERDFPDKIIRAAQFAPFAALTGYGDVISEAARVTNRKIQLDDYEKEELNRKITYIYAHSDKEKIYTIVYFVKDKHKNGGKYVEIKDGITKIKESELKIVTSGGIEIPIDDILSIET